MKEITNISKKSLCQKQLLSIASRTMQACAHPAHKYLCYVRNNVAHAWTEPLQTSKLGSFSAVFNGFSLLTIAA